MRRVLKYGVAALAASNLYCALAGTVVPDLKIFNVLSGLYPVELKDPKDPHSSMKQVFWSDDRQELPADRWTNEFSWVTRLMVPNGRCTSFFIDPPYPIPEGTALQVTAAHCVQQGDMSIYYAYKEPVNGTTRIPRLPVVHKWVHPEYKKEEEKESQNDIALLLVATGDRPVHTVDYQLIEPGDKPPQKLDALGYAYDIPNLAGHFGCKAISIDRYTLNTACDLASGESGGPMRVTNGPAIAVNGNVALSRTSGTLLSNSILPDRIEFQKWIGAYKAPVPGVS